MYRVIIAGLLLPAAPAAAQPFSDSMADCAGILTASRDYITTPERVDQIDFLVTQWTKAAHAQAIKEGRPQPDAAVIGRVEATAGEWRAKGPSFAFSEDFRDWMGYCRSFARSQGIKLTRD